MTESALIFTNSGERLRWKLGIFRRGEWRTQRQRLPLGYPQPPARSERGEAIVTNRHQARNGPSAVGDLECLPLLHLAQVAACVLAQLPDPDGSHDATCSTINPGMDLPVVPDRRGGASPCAVILS